VKAEADRSFAEILRQYRLAAGLSQEALAERARLSVRGISDLERGARTAPRASTISRLADALGLQPGARQTLVRAAQGVTNGIEVEVERRHTSVVASLSSFIGRTAELVEIRARLDSGRMLTLVGPGGVGKTRLAFEAARRSADVYAAVFIVELAPIVSSSAVGPAVADAVSAPDVTGRPILEAIAAALGAERTLLILDNCEHVVGAAAEVAAYLLRACDGLTVLATSREPLNIEGEVLFRVPSLALPSGAEERLLDVESVQLFFERARAVHSGFELTTANAGAAADVCRRLDGIPLAIELAAARARALSVEEIAVRLDDRFRLLIGGSRTAMPHQRTLAATLDWSYQLLDSAEQALLRRLAVFAGGWSLEAAEAVGSDDPLSADGVLDVLTELVDRSLVQADLAPGQSEGRYHLLETVRQYAAARLEEADEASRTRDRHLLWMTAWAAETVPRLVSGDQVRWLKRISVEHDNFRAALEWARTQRRTQAELRLAANLGRFWHLRGASREGRFWLLHALEVGPETPSAERALALNWAGRLATVNGLSDDRRLLEDSAAVAGQIGDQAVLALAMRHLSMATKRDGDEAASRAALERALEAARLANDRREEAFALVSLGATLEQAGETETARRMLLDGLTLGRDVGDAGPVGWALTVLGAIALREGDHDRAARLLAQALAVARPMGYWAVVVTATAELAALARAQDDLDTALARGRECLVEAHAAGDNSLIAAALATVGDLELQAGRVEHGTRLLSAESAWRASLGGSRVISIWSWPAPAPDVARARLGEAEFARAWAAGQRLTLDQAVQDALSS
jgi:predicted ATPase